MFHFKPAFMGAIKLALAVYPDARVEADEGGMTLYPSAPPVGRAGLQALRIAS